MTTSHQNLRRKCGAFAPQIIFDLGHQTRCQSNQLALYSTHETIIHTSFELLFLPSLRPLGRTILFYTILYTTV
jgi:hypothetical protein